MAAPVWVLQVDLQTKTATFTSGLGDAAKAARGTFSDIKSGAAGMGRDTSYSMMEARHGVMLLGEGFGVHLPRAVSGFIASIGPVGAAMEAAFPFLAIIAGAVLLVEHLKKLHEEGVKLTEEQVKFGTAVQNAFNALDEKILSAQIKADNLRNDHLGALRLQLELIDRQSMSELVQSFGIVAKAADEVFKTIVTHWYNFGTGAEGAKHALDSFQLEYAALMAKGKTEEASGLLDGTLKQARSILDAFGTIKTFDTQRRTGFRSGDAAKDAAQYRELTAAQALLQQAGLKGTQDELTAQRMLVSALEDDVSIRERAARLSALEKGNARTETAKTMQGEAGKHGDALLKYNEALNRMIADDDKQAVDGLRQRERDKIQATREGSEARLQAISAAIQEEESEGRTANEFYRGLLAERNALLERMSDEASKLAAEAAREEAAHQSRMATLALGAEREHAQLMDSVRRVTMQQRLQQELRFAQEEYSIKMHEYADELAALDKNAKDYENKLKAIQDREKELIRQHENEIKGIKEKAQQEQNASARAAMNQWRDDAARGLTDVIMRHQTFAQMVTSLGDTIASTMIQNAVRNMMTLDMTKEKEAAAAARNAFLAGWHFPFPANIVAAPVMAAGAYAAVMAFQEGGLVPGIGNRDTVPAVLTPGEHVADKRLTQGLQKMVDSGDSGPRYTIHVRPVYNVQTIDGNGMKEALEKHANVLQRHFESAVRRMNR